MLVRACKDQEAIEDTTIYVLKERASSGEQDTGVGLEGIKVLEDLDTVTLAVAGLNGLNLSGPADPH